MARVLIISASNNHNLQLAGRIEAKLNSMGHAARCIDLVELELPLFTPLVEERDGVPDKINQLLPEMKSVQGFAFVSPEYNGGVPPSLTSFLAWISRTDKNWRECFNGKSGLIASHSGSGGPQVLSAMRIQLSYLGLNLIGRQLNSTTQKPLNEDSLSSVVEQLVATILR